MSLESGIGSTRSGSSIEHFFNTLLPDLEHKLGQEECLSEMDDQPSIDFPAENDVRDVAIRQPSPVRQPKQQVPSKRSNMPAISQKDPLMEELELIKSEFDKRSRYGDKLAEIMVRGLRNTLVGGLYDLFVTGRLPTNWYPIIRMNNDNTPYVEFIIKSDVADQDPDSQFSDYTMSHILVSQIILQDLRGRERGKPTGHTRGAPKAGPTTILPPTQKKIRQYPERMECSTPRKTVAHVPQPSCKVDLNDSKRILPPRACKSNTTITYTGARKRV